MLLKPLAGTTWLPSLKYREIRQALSLITKARYRRDITRSSNEGLAMVCEPIARSSASGGRSGDLTEINTIGVKTNYVKLYNFTRVWKTFS